MHCLPLKSGEKFSRAKIIADTQSEGHFWWLSFVKFVSVPKNDKENSGHFLIITEWNRPMAVFILMSLFFLAVFLLYWYNKIEHFCTLKLWTIMLPTYSIATIHGDHCKSWFFWISLFAVRYHSEYWSKKFRNHSFSMCSYGHRITRLVL